MTVVKIVLFDKSMSAKAFNSLRQYIINRVNAIKTEHENVLEMYRDVYRKIDAASNA